IVVVLSNKVFVYMFSAKPQKLHTFDTIDNDKGLVALSSSENHAILAFPGRQKGHIQIVDLNTFHATTAVTRNNTAFPANSSSSSSFPHHRRSSSFGGHNDLQPPSIQDRRPSVSNGSRPGSIINSSGSTTVMTMTTNISIIPAHTGKLSCLSVNADGSKCASASEKGTLIRVFDTSTGKLLNELRRGVDRAEIYSIAFNHDSTRLCVSSDKGTVHIFNLDVILGNG
ncbi:17910_t:CDS:2, partial [Cetraspora pellucida]